MGLKTDAVAAAATLTSTELAGAGTAPNRAGTDVGVDIYALTDTFINNVRDLQRLASEIDRVAPAGTFQTAWTSLMATLT